ncbi:Golgi-associated plant pathogenesis-related protein 1-like isoform X1 [Haliotis rubra]|uniref:Golgi-associated plant pathogenesis-related protein 1-like isoform X1 n=1 Tax=Haliotis rubra TaxID=36100 RepID=UPI001EE5F02D|nr:Golgi-associated plant pathogenesis-related protein 1-like isoform X1 [Haliotis rubra]
MNIVSSLWSYIPGVAWMGGRGRSDEDFSLFKQEMIKGHNSFRMCHGSPELSPSEDLCKESQVWANSLSERGYLQYSETSGVGENIIFLDLNGKDPVGEEVSKQWYRECAKYDYSTPRWRKGAMNFTQMIWRSTSEIGVGISKVKGQDRYVVVTQYRPAGNNNMPGEFRKNVLPPQ